MWLPKVAKNKKTRTFGSLGPRVVDKNNLEVHSRLAAAGKSASGSLKYCHHFCALW